jgi:two-component system, NtrC family, nitrogen regulation response regulator GlnG
MDKAKVLLVEDDNSIGVVVCAALSAEGIYTEVCDSAAARDAALSENEFDLMITDVMLKDSDGIASIAPVKTSYPDMPIIVISAQNTLETAVRASEIDAFEYFPKPFDLNELVIAVKQGIERRHYKPSTQNDMIEANMPMVGRSLAMQEVYRMVARLLRNDLSVLILGESGTGKELVAEAIHNLGHRKTGPFVAVNMAAIPADLIEAELFGHEKGAFTGATGQSIGRFEQAQGGTLFLDEIGDMPMLAQTRLLRALQSGVISRVGGKASIRLDVRIIAATHQNLEQRIAAGSFREDLYYRLNVVPISMPPLRERPDDIGLLAQHFLKIAATEGLPLRDIDNDAIALLSRMSWRGNVRELRNLIFRLALVCREDVISEATIRQIIESTNDSEPIIGGCSFEAAVSQFLSSNRKNAHHKDKIYPRALAAFEIPLFQTVLKQSRGNQLKAAALLGINRNTLRKKLTEYNITTNGAG